MIGINGFGRIGRNILRQSNEVLEINQPNATIEDIYYLAKYDTLLGEREDIELKDKNLIIQNKIIHFYSYEEPKNIPWKSKIIIDCSGKFKTKKELNEHIKNNVEVVILTAPPKDDMDIIINGCNLYNGQKIFSAGSCTSNCLLPIIDLFDKKFGIKNGHFLTVHAVTNSQSVVDRRHKEKRLGRDANVNIIPTSTGASKLVVSCFPHLNGKIYGSSVRVPVENGSFLEVYLEVLSDLDVEQVIKLIENHEILSFSDNYLVSSDIKRKNHICLIDKDLIKFYDRRRICIGAWYNNEGGYVKQLLEIIRKNF